MQNFITGLQFLTRLKFVEEKEWTAEKFSGSVKFFPLVGAVIGFLFALFTYIILQYFPEIGVSISPILYATFMIFLWVFLTGALHCDGFMDTMDGVFSGRSREKMLIIMKDSCVGANGVVGFFLLALSKWSLLFEIAQTSNIIVAVFVMPIIARCMMVVGITLFPYARPEGLGKYFATYVNKKTLFVALVLTVFLLIPCGIRAMLSMFIAIIFTMFFCQYITKQLGGLTGDVYGALTEITEVIVLLTFLR